MRQFVALTAFLFLLNFSGIAQVVLFSENFDACVLSPGWEIHKTGNQNPVWYVGATNQNDDNNGQSMNGSCFLFVDDDATGDQTEGYILDFISPSFDASQYPDIELSVDVHYRDWNEADESFEVLMTDGTTETLLRRYDKFRSTGNNLYEFETLKFDLALLTQSPTVRLIFRYNDAGGFNWWAGVDNISVIGSGTGTNVVAEAFNGCTKPAGWETEIVSGVDDWKFGLITEGKALSGGNSMDGTCFAFFDDDFLGQTAPFSTVRLLSPWFDGSQFGQFTASFDVILRYYAERIALIVQHANGDEFLVVESQGDVAGPYFSNYAQVEYDLSAFRSQQMRILFQYTDGQNWGWWAGIDNVKVTGSGIANDLCSNALPLITGQICQLASNANALLDGPPAPCVEKSVGGLWYSWTADFTGTARFQTNAEFNDVVNIFTGDCTAPQLLLCDNRDEHGFHGESTHFAVETGTTYFFRVSGRDGGFGVPRGNLCVGIMQSSGAPVPPVNDDCSNALTLEIDAACLTGHNIHASTSLTRPTYNELARHDVWYGFTAPALAANEILEIQSNSSFSDIITVYSGGCNALVELATNYKGRILDLSGLSAGETYLIQISGTFATIEGALCPQIIRKNLDAPANDLCSFAIPVPIGGACLNGSNVGATYSGLRPPCVISIENDVWYSFVAPASGSVQLNSGADFPHVIAVWKGECGNFENVLCAKDPLRCDGFIHFGALSAGETYYVQIGAQSAPLTQNTGEFCLQILDGALPPPFEPIGLTVQEKCISTNLTKLKIEAHGGVLPYVFSGNPDGQNLSSGESYLVVVTDGLGCEKALTGITEDCEALACALTGTITPLQPTCFNSANGMLAAMVTGGTVPYTYLWSNGASTAEISALQGGAYSVTITDALECDVVLSALLVDPAPITAVPTSIEQPHQGQSDGSIYLDVSGGNGLFNFVWLQNGAPFVNAEDLTNAPAGDYTLIITDGNGCSASFDFTLTETVGNQEVSTEFFTEVFPNPAQEKAWLAVAFPKSETLHLTLLDAAGSVLKTCTVREVTEQNIPLDLKHLPAGTYQLQILTGKERIVEQVVIGDGHR